ncbi:hypothetical protein E8E14_007350 [Neopestalotiopsis sp. 37M]|nr:hypothetical protein E8E14_007350 [Neopestalotiopsis sp. 37M]
MFQSVATKVGNRLLSVIILAPFVAAADDAEFAFNLLSDVAPVLALFGEQFATQFMSESLSCFDHVIFAMVPLGIIAAITGAIRVQGRSVAKAFIGRARENRALAEIELMSSTSDEVCELFNGTSIVRVTGKPKIAQFFIFPKTYKALEDGYRHLDQPLQDGSSGEEPSDHSCGIHTLSTANEMRKDGTQLMKCEEYQSDSYVFLRTSVKSVWKVAQKLIRLPYTSMRDLVRVTPDTDVEETTQNVSPVTEEASETQKTNDTVGSSDKERALACPPNLRLNLSVDYCHNGHFIEQHEILVAVTIAVLLQISLIAIAASTAFEVSPNSSSLFESSVYGFPCYVAGSIVLSFGTGLCSFIVERSTFECSWEVTGDNTPSETSKTAVTETEKPELVWLQKKQEVSDQAFNGYLISAGPKRRAITSSRKYDTRTKKNNNETQSDGLWAGLTILAALSAGVGFTAQFMGLRGLAFPCSIAHLGAIFIMALIRSYIRRRLGRKPASCAAHSGHELDFLATKYVFDPKPQDDKVSHSGKDLDNGILHTKKFFRWRVHTPDPHGKVAPVIQILKRTPACDQKESAPSSQQLLRVRTRLGDLSKWTSKSSASALSLVRSIEAFMNTMFPDPQSHKKSFEWFLEASAALPDDPIKTKDAIGFAVKRDSKWKADLGTVEAALSLWLASINAENAEDTAIRATYDWRRAKADDSLICSFYRIIGDKLSDGALKRDISWWVDSLVAEQSGGTKGREHAEVVIGFNGIEDNTNADGELGIISNAPLPIILAQHIFTSFMWTIAQALPKDCLDPKSDGEHPEVMIEGPLIFNSDEFDQTWPRLRMRHRTLTKLVGQMESYGLGSTNDILLCMIPALSVMKLLPNQEVRSLIPRVRPGYSFREPAVSYSMLLRRIGTIEMAGEDIDYQDKLNVSIIIDTMDFLSLAYESYDGQELQRLSDLPDELKEVVEELASDRFVTIMQKLTPIYQRQHRYKTFEKLFKQFGQETFANRLKMFKDPASLDREFAKNVLAFTPLHLWVFSIIDDDSFSYSDVDRKLTEERTSMMSPDIFGWTLWHYSCTTDSILTAVLLRFSSGTVDRLPKLLDTLQRSPIHIAALDGMDKNMIPIFSRLSADSWRSVIQSGGLDGMTPLHLSCRNGSMRLFRSIFQRRKTPESLLNQQDIWGRQALHIATIFGHDRITTELLGMGSNPDQVDNTGKTPIDYFSEIRQLKHTTDTDFDQEYDNAGPDGLSIEDSELFLMFSNNNPGYRYSGGRTFLHRAVELIHPETVSKLLDKKFEIEAIDDHGQTPLHYAILAGRASMAEALIQGIKGHAEKFFANPSAKDSHNTTTLMFAARKDLKSVAQVLLCMPNVHDIDQRDDDGETALHHACGLEMVELLVQKRCDTLIRNSSGRTALHTAIAAGHKEIAGFLLELKYPDQVQEKPYDMNMDSLLITACQRGLSEVVPKIVERWPSCVNSPGKSFGQTPLSCACEYGHSDTVKELLRHEHVDINKPATGWRKLTPLHLAVRAQKSDLVQLILENNRVKLDPETDDGETPLQLAVENNCLDIAQQLVRHTRTTLPQKIRYLKEFVSSPSASDFHQLSSEILRDVKNESSVSQFLVWLVCDGAPMRKDREKITNDHVSAFLKPLAGEMMREAWMQRHDPFDVVDLFHKSEVRATLIRDCVDNSGFDQDNWSYLDYIQRFDSNNTLTEAFTSANEATTKAKDGYKVPKALVALDDQASIRLEPCKSHEPGSCPGIREIKVIKESTDNWRLCMRSDYSIPPNEKFFYFEIEILEDSPSKILGIGFCTAGDTTDAMPGWFQGSWGFHGDDGAVFVESGYGVTPSSDFGVAGEFGCGDTVGAYLNMETGHVFCTLNGELLDMGNEVNQPTDRFRFEKIYPCVGFSLNRDGVGLRFMVNFDGSDSHPFAYSALKRTEGTANHKSGVIGGIAVDREPFQHETNVALVASRPMAN